MTSRNNQLWELILRHKMPDDAAGTTFVDQLVAENRIARDTAEVAILEYRKFMYLCASRAARNVPSRAVDLVWHLHMQHSRDYWDVFCKLLGKPVHHTPGVPSAAHLDDYRATVAAYREVFGTPPKGIWRENDKGERVAALFGSLAAIVVGAMFGMGPEGNIEWVFLSLFGVFWFLKTLVGFTAQGEFTLVFEHGDPFADQDAGECGSGDGGGCGD